MANSPSIVIASLSDDQLKKSIDSLVTHVDEAMKKMVQSTNNAVGEMEAKLKSLGNLKIDTGGTNDGGTGRRTQQHEKLTKAVNDASEAVTKETQKLQDLQQSLSGASDREQNFISQKERATNTIAQENELLSKQQSELATLKTQQQSLASGENLVAEAENKRKIALDSLNAKMKELGEMQNKLLQKGSGITPNEKKLIGIDQTTIQLISRMREELSKLDSTFGGVKYSKGEFANRFSGLDTIKRELEANISQFKNFRNSSYVNQDEAHKVDIILKKYKEYLAVVDELYAKQGKLEKNHTVFNYTDAYTKYYTSLIPVIKADRDLTEAENNVFNAVNSSARASQQKAQIDAQVAAKEKEIAETKGRIAAATKEQTEADKNASQAAREKANIQSQVANQEKQVAEANKQLTTATQQQAEVEKQSVQNVVQQTAARDKQIKKNQEVAMSFDRMANAQQVAIRSASPSGIRNADTLQTMNIQLDLLRERLREARQQYSSFVALAAHATTTGDKGLFQYATDGVHRYEQEVRNLIPQIRTLQSGIQQMGDVIAPQGHTIQNYVNSLQKANPELAALNAQYKSGTSLLQDQSTSYASATQSAQRYTEEIRKQAQAIRESRQWKEKGYTTIGDKVFYDPERSVASAKNRLSLEEQIILAQKKESEAAAIAAQEAISHAQAQKQVEEAAARTAQILETMSHYQTNVNKMQQDSTKLTSGRYGVGVNSFAQFDDLQVAISRVIGVEHQQIKIVDESYDSYKRLSTSLYQLKAAYNSLNESERNSDNGRILVQRMQVIERSMQKIQAQAARPISLGSVMGLSEKTIDDIAYKMRQLASYRSGLNVETQVKEIEQVNMKYAQLQKNMNDIMQKNTDMIASNTALGRSWNYMKNRLAFYFTVGASTSFVKNLIDIRSQYELLERSIGILFDSMQTGSKIFSELNQMAIKSPFTTMELGSAAKQLSAYNIAAKDVVDTTRRLADMAAAVGIPIERLTYALGQIKSYGYLNSRDARMFANAGIPLIQNLADMYTKLEGRLVSIGDVYDRIKKKQVSFEDTLKVVHEMTDEGGRFFNFQEKAADTLKVRLANLTLAWNNMLNNMGKSNQGVLTSGLGVLKEMFENWRKIENIILAIATNFGTVKAIQLLMLLNAKGITKQMALQEVLGKRLGATIYGIARNLRMLAVNPMTWLTIVITAVTYLSWKFWDLTNANENFNKSIADGTKENIASIDKFFDKYRKDIESVGSMKTTDQEKMWERVRDEIEKATKNAQQYIDILEKIPELDKRVSKASGFLEQEKVIQEELNRLAQHGYFNIGGGFADDSYAEALTTIDKYTGEMIRKYGTYEDYIKAFKDEFQGFYDEFRDAKFSWNINEEIDESVKHFKKLESLNWGRILSGGTDEEKLARIRDTFMSLRDNFFATEEMQNAGAEAQALYNRHMDYWITSVARANGLIKELTVNGKTYSAEDIAAVEERRTEWEAFFSYLSDEERRTMDYLVKTNQTGGEEFKKLWDTMADSMRKSNATAYRDLQKKIAELRETPDIVINVVYREMRDKLDEQQKAFEDRWIRPKDWSVRNLSAEDYLEEETANRTKYGRLMRKTEEDNVEWEERLGKEYQENAKKIKSLNAQLNNKKNLSEADREQKEKDLNLYKDLNKAIIDIGKAENFNYNQFKKGGNGSKKDPLLDSLKLEASLVEKLQGEYDKLTKSGASQAEALETIRGAYGKTIRLLNAQLGKYGLPQLDISQLITGKDPHKALEHFKNTLNTLVDKGILTLERSKELEAVMEKLTISAKTYDLDMITKGLNNELGKLKDEYELAVAIDADPELGNAFADMMGINVESLPHTVKEYADEYSKYLNKYLKGKNSEMQLTGDELRGLTSDDINALQSQVDAGTFNQEWFDVIKKAYEDVSGKRKKDLEETEKWKNSLIEKYGNLQDKLTKIYKDSVQNQVNAVKTFSKDEGQKSEIVRLQLRLEKADNPAELAEINTEIAKIVKDVTDKNPIALKLVTASSNQTKSDVSKAYWEDFKNSDMYTMTFEDMANNSTRAIELIIDKLNSLKDHVKEDPASMKALIKSLEDAEKELNARDPFGGIARSLKNMEEASKETKTAQEALWRSEVDVEQAQQAYDNAEDGTPEERAAAQQRLADAIQKRSAAEVNLTRAESKHKKAQENLKSSLQGVTGQLGNVKSLFDTVSSLFRAGGDDETADAIDAISEGFSVMTTVIMGVVSAMVILESSQPWLLAIAAALSVIVGLVSFLSGSENKKIDRQVEQSELAVKRLELAYIDLEHAVKEAYGMATIGANMAAKANKELQLAELKRQLALERSRDSKDRDEGKILDLQKQIKELEYEIADTANDIVNDLLGISSVGDAMESLMDGFIEALRNGEDAMAVFDETIDDMIANMVKKMFVTKILQPWFEEQWNKIQDQITKRAGDLPNELAKVQSSVSNAKMADVNNNDSLVDALRALGYSEEQIDSLVHYFEDGTSDVYQQGTNSRLRREYEKALKEAEEKEAKLQKDLTTATTISTDDIRQYAELLRSGQPVMDENMKAIEDLLKELGLMKDSSNKNLSALQQGIQGITEDTAGALEAYMNGVSQQVYLHSDLLTQIRDAVVGIDIDVQVATQAQMLLQLQQSYAVQMAIQGILEGVLNPSGRAFSVELVS